MNYGSNVCPDCRATTSGDCGRHGYTIVRQYIDNISDVPALNAELASLRAALATAQAERDGMEAGVTLALLRAGEPDTKGTLADRVDHLLTTLRRNWQEALGERDIARQEAAAAQQQVAAYAAARDEAQRRLSAFNAYLFDAPTAKTQCPLCRAEDAKAALARLRQEREGLIAILKKCAGWVLIRIESNIEQHGVCASRECGYAAGTNADCPVCRWTINARMFYEDITKALLAAPPTEAQGAAQARLATEADRG